MSRQEIEAMWKEYNEMYGLDMEMPEGMIEDLENFSMKDVEYEMAMGGSFDGAMQRTMNF